MSMSMSMSGTARTSGEDSVGKAVETEVEMEAETKAEGGGPPGKVNNEGGESSKINRGRTTQDGGEFLSSHFQSHGEEEFGMEVTSDLSDSDPDSDPDSGHDSDPGQTEINQFLEDVHAFFEGGLFAWSPFDGRWLKE
jgi:hypothetical protein